MSSCVDVASEQVCYIPCNFCSIILAVSVPCTSLFDIVTVRCGHCTHLWSVNMAVAVQSLSSNNPQTASFSSKDHHVDHASSSTCNRMTVRAPPSTNDKRMENRPPEKRQRVPSPYNQFIKEEIQRIKANNPHISHKEAFSTAAKNWAHYPHIRFGLMLETSNEAKAAEGPEKQLMMNF